MHMRIVATLMPALGATVLASGLVPASRRVVPQSQSTVTISSKDASKEQKSPVILDIGEVVKGRLGESGNGAGYHYWKAGVPAGKYRVVLDVKFAGGQRRNLQSEIVAFRLDGSQLGKVLSTNEIDYRLRSVTEIDSTKDPEFVLRVGNHSGIVDYWLGLFPVDGDIAAPYFVGSPAIQPFEFGKPLSAVLDAKPGAPAEVWYSTKLKAGDYRVSVEFTRTDGRKAAVQGDVVMFGPLGQRFSRGHPTICRVNEADVTGKCISKLMLSEDMVVFFRVAPTNDDGYKTVFSIEPHGQS